MFNNLMYTYSQKTDKPYVTKIKSENIFLELDFGKDFINFQI